MPPHIRLPKYTKENILKNDFLDYNKKTYELYDSNRISRSEMKTFIKIYSSSIDFTKNLFQILEECEPTKIDSREYLDPLNGNNLNDLLSFEDGKGSYIDVFTPIFSFIYDMNTSFEDVYNFDTELEYSNRIDREVNIDKKPYLEKMLKNINTFIRQIKTLLDLKPAVTSNHENLFGRMYVLSPREQKVVGNLYLHYVKSLRTSLSLEACDSSFDMEQNSFNYMIESLDELVYKKNCKELDCDNPYKQRFSRKKALEADGYQRDILKECFNLEKDYVSSIGDVETCKKLVDKSIWRVKKSLICNPRRVNDTLPISTTNSPSTLLKTDIINDTLPISNINPPSYLDTIVENGTMYNTTMEYPQTYHKVIEGKVTDNPSLIYETTTSNSGNSCLTYPYIAAVLLIILLIKHIFKF